ncbi:MAG TPA: ferredoxin reductase family protein [Candidatus Dormibacteraeota bacterium]|nr:ferredoxin reductase family protein [Candidatus Dormibacteraeota bacterium]
MTVQSLSGALARRDRRTTAVPMPRDWTWLTPRDLWLVVGGVGAVIAAMWLRHGGLARDPLTGLGEVTALAGTYAALVGVLLISRAPWIDQVLGTDGLRAAHRILGFVAVWAIGAHAVFSTLAYAGGSLTRVMPTLVSLVDTVPGMLGAIVSMGLFALVGVTSVRAIRRRFSYETWHGLHLYAYLAVAFGYLHQLAIGGDFATDPLATGFWIGLYLAAFGPLVLHRIAWPVYLTLRHRPRVAAVEPEADGVFSLYVEGRDLDRLAVRSGQFFVVRALTRADWGHGHPFSISAAPNGRHLRFTIKEFGGGTQALRRLEPGTALMLEGPYGAMTGARRTGARLLLIAGGIGISPLRAMAESFAYARGDMALLYRTRDRDDVALRRELEALAERRGIELHVVAGRRGEPGTDADPLGPKAIRRLVPDAADRDIYLCGPNPLMERARVSLLALGARPERINLELFT